MDRKKFLATGAAGAAGLIVPSLAEATTRPMGPRFAHKLELAANGSHIYAHGPLGAHEHPAYVSVVIKQNGHFAHGMSGRYGARHEGAWTAVAHVDSHRFHVGAAMAHGVVVMPEADEVYAWAWSMPVTLVH